MKSARALISNYTPPPKGEISRGGAEAPSRPVAVFQSSVPPRLCVRINPLRRYIFQNQSARAILATGLFAALLAGCEPPEEAPIRLTSRERIRIDTLANQQIDSLRPIMDSICDAAYQEILERAVDSLVDVRKREEEKLRARIQREQQ